MASVVVLFLAFLQLISGIAVSASKRNNEGQLRVAVNPQGDVEITQIANHSGLVQVSSESNVTGPAPDCRGCTAYPQEGSSDCCVKTYTEDSQTLDSSSGCSWNLPPALLKKIQSDTGDDSITSAMEFDANDTYADCRTIPDKDGVNTQADGETRTIMQGAECDPCVPLIKFAHYNTDEDKTGSENGKKRSYFGGTYAEKIYCEWSDDEDFLKCYPETPKEHRITCNYEDNDNAYFGGWDRKKASKVAKCQKR